MTGKEMTKEEIQQAVEVFKPNFDIEKPIQELMNGHYLLCGYAYNVSRELMKYKRAFEILKNNCHISNYVVDGVNSGKKITFDVIREWYDKEEYELLEELMKSE